MPDEPTESQIDSAARARALKALEDIEAAQRKADEAAQQLSSLVGWVRTYEDVCSHVEKLHDLWGRVRSKLNDSKQHIRLDDFGMARMKRERKK